MNTCCPLKRVPSADRFFLHCRLTMQPPWSYSVGGQCSSRQLTDKPAGARPDYRGHWCEGQRTTSGSSFVTYGGSKCVRPYDPEKIDTDLKALIKQINKNTAAQKEQTERWKLELELLKREPTELDLLLQKWEVELPSREPEEVKLPSREPEGVELPSREPEGVELPSRGPEDVKPWLSQEPPAAVKGEEVPQPPTLQASLVLPREVPCPDIVDTWSECPDLPTLDLVPSTARHSCLSGPFLSSP
ncbi:UNVERIFIED_CONTAM: hypothetical protein FKN15_051269 [Acipenser sinensis]